MRLCAALALLLAAARGAEAASLVLPLLLDFQPMVLAIDVASPMNIEQQLNEFCSHHLIANTRCHVLFEAVADVVRSQPTVQAFCQPSTKRIDVSFALMKNVLVSPGARSATSFKWMQDEPQNIAGDICLFMANQAPPSGDASILSDCGEILASAFAQSFNWINSLSVCELSDQIQRIVPMAHTVEEPLALKILAVEQLIASIKSTPVPVITPRPLHRIANDVYLTPWSDEDEVEQQKKSHEQDRRSDTTSESQEEPVTPQPACRGHPSISDPQECNMDSATLSRWCDASEFIKGFLSSSKTSEANGLLESLQVPTGTGAVEATVLKNGSDTDETVTPGHDYETPATVGDHDRTGQLYQPSHIESLDTLFGALTVVVGMTLVLVLVQAAFEGLLMAAQCSISTPSFASWRVKPSLKNLTNVVTPMTTKETIQSPVEHASADMRLEKLASANKIVEATRLRLALIQWRSETKATSAIAPTANERLVLQSELPIVSHLGYAPPRTISIAAASLFVAQHNLPCTITSIPRSGETAQALREVTELLTASSSTDELLQRLRLSESLVRLRRRVAVRKIQRMWRKWKTSEDRDRKNDKSPQPNRTMGILQRIRRLDTGFSLFHARTVGQTAPSA